MQPISTAVQELFNEGSPGVAITVDGPGTGDGFALFCAGELDIADASRAIKPEGEADVCATNGVEYVELKVALDGLSVREVATRLGVSKSFVHSWRLSRRVPELAAVSPR